MSPRAGAPLVVGAAVLWGTAGAVQELALPATSPTSVAGLRSLLGGAVLLVGMAALGRGRQLRATLQLGGSALLVATVAMLVFQVGYLEGIRRSGVAVGTLTALGTAPIWAGLLAIARGRRPSARWAVATVVGLVGLVLLVAPGLRTGASVVGVVAGVAAGGGYAAFATTTVVLVGRRVDRLGMMAVVFLACGVLLAPAVVVRPVVDDAGWPAVGGLVWLGLATITVAYLLFATGLRDVDAPTATTLTLAEPLTATLLAVVVVDEVLGVVEVTGLLAIVAGLSLAARDRPGTRRDGRPPPPTRPVDAA